MGEFQSHQYFWIVFASFNITYFEFIPIGTGFRECVRNHFCMNRKCQTKDCNRTIGRHLIRIQKYTWFSVQWFFSVVNAIRKVKDELVSHFDSEFNLMNLLLMLQSCVHFEIIMIAMIFRRRILFIIVCFGELFMDFLPCITIFQIWIW